MAKEKEIKTLITKDAEGKEPYQQDRIYAADGIAPALNCGKADLNIGLIEIGEHKPQAQRIYDPAGISATLNAQGGGLGAKTGLYAVKPCITPDRINKRQNGRRFKEDGEESFTLNTQDRHGVLLDNGEEIQVRKLTPKECFRLQGFPDEYFERAAAVCSDSQLYKQAGNSVTVNVIYEIARRLK